MVLIDKFTNPYWSFNHVKAVQKVKKDQKDLHAAWRQAEALLVSSRSIDLPIYSISHVENEGYDYYCTIIMVRFHNSISI